MVGACEKDRKLSNNCLYVLSKKMTSSAMHVPSLLALDEAESVGEISGESSHCRRLIRVCPSGMSKLSLSTTASASGSDGLSHETQTQIQPVRLLRTKLRHPTQIVHTVIKCLYIPNIITKLQGQ